MTDIVVDASVVVKWYIPERNHEQARELRDQYLRGHHDLLAPTLLPFETIHALRCSGVYDGEHLNEAATTLPEYGITLVGFHDIGPVAAVAHDHDITVSDASYLALTASRDASFYTADATLLESVDGHPSADSVAHIRDYPH